jgi:hypothetical protein
VRDLVATQAFDVAVESCRWKNFLFHGHSDVFDLFAFFILLFFGLAANNKNAKITNNEIFNIAYN